MATPKRQKNVSGKNERAFGRTRTWREEIDLLVENRRRKFRPPHQDPHPFPGDTCYRNPIESTPSNLKWHQGYCKHVCSDLMSETPSINVKM